MKIKGHDDWLWKQADDYMSRCDENDDCLYEDEDEYGSDCECDKCQRLCRQDYEESRADYLYEQERERRFYDKYN